MTHTRYAHVTPHVTFEFIWNINGTNTLRPFVE